MQPRTRSIRRSPSTSAPAMTGTRAKERAFRRPGLSRVREGRLAQTRCMTGTRRSGALVIRDRRGLGESLRSRARPAASPGRGRGRAEWLDELVPARGAVSGPRARRGGTSTVTWTGERAVEESASMLSPSRASAVRLRYSSRAARMPGAKRSPASRTCCAEHAAEWPGTRIVASPPRRPIAVDHIG